MTTLATSIDLDSEEFGRNRERMLECIAEVEEVLAEAVAGGGERQVKRHRGRGRLMPRERIELLLDRDAPFLELMPYAAYGTDFPVGASYVTGVGLVEGVECAIAASDPTVRGGTINPYTVRKLNRLQEIAHENRLPHITLLESGGADLPTWLETGVSGGETYRRLSEMSRDRVPTITTVFGNATAGGAYVPGMSDHNIFIQDQSHVFLGGEALVKMATGEDSTAEELGGGDMHARMSGLAEYLAVDERDALRLTRQVIRTLNWRKLGPGPASPVRAPLHDEEDLLGVAPANPKESFDMLEVIGRIVDGSDYDEFKPLYGTAMTTGWATIHGFPVGIIANQRGVIFSEEAQKTCQFIQLVNSADVPLLFLVNTTGYMVGKEYEQKGIIKHGALMIHAVACSAVPHITLLAGGSYGAGNYGMGGFAFKPNFAFAWPQSKLSIMGPEQLAGVLSIVAREAAQARGVEFDAEADAKRSEAIIEQIERESQALSISGRIYDEGIIDPRDTRETIAIALSACHSNEVRGADRFATLRV